MFLSTNKFENNTDFPAPNQFFVQDFSIVEE